MGLLTNLWQNAQPSKERRQALITETLNGLYTDAAEKYREVNKDVLEANKAQEKLTDSMARLGAIIEPILTQLKRKSS